MFILSKNNNKLSIYKGDTGVLMLSVKKYTFMEGDKVVMSIKKNADDEDYILQKEVTEFPNNKVVFFFTAEEIMKIELGTYKYDVKAILVDGRKDRIVTPSLLEVLDGVNDDE